MSADNAADIYAQHRRAGRLVAVNGESCLLVHPDDWSRWLDAIAPQQVAGDDMTEVRLFGHRIVHTSSLGRVLSEWTDADRERVTAFGEVLVNVADALGWEADVSSDRDVVTAEFRLPPVSEEST